MPLTSLGVSKQKGPKQDNQNLAKGSIFLREENLSFI